MTDTAKKPGNGHDPNDVQQVNIELKPEHVKIACETMRLMKDAGFTPMDCYIPLAMAMLYLQQQLRIDPAMSMANFAGVYEAILSNQAYAVEVIKKIHIESSQPKIWLPH